ncbi:MAG: ABC transporter permease, partial [Planctomycetia bacterium]
MTALDTKLWRDLRRLSLQLAAVAVVMACGVAMVVMAWSMLRSLALTQAAYYADARFADVFVHLKRAPDVVGRRLAALPGIGRLDTRVVEDVTLDLPDTHSDRANQSAPVPTIGRFISLPDRGPDGLHQLHIVKGRFPDPARRSEAVVSEGFAMSHRLEPGDSLHAILNGRRTRLDLVGIATSPEYVYTIRTGDLFPDDRSFGIVWIDRKALAAAFDMEDAFNDVIATLAPGARLEDVCRALDRELDRYGSLSAFGREFQPSHRYLTNELRELRNMGLVAPIVFLAVTAILMHLVLSRLVGTQREQIATLAAFGYTPREIGGHFLTLAAAVVAAGAALGVAGGWVLGQQLTAIYSGFFRFPILRFEVDRGVVAFSIAIAAAAALLGVVQA